MGGMVKAEMRLSDDLRTTERRGICPVDAYVCYTDGSATKAEGHIEASAGWGLRILLDGDGRVDVMGQMLLLVETRPPDSLTVPELER